METPEIKRNSHDFSFLDTAADIATNNDFREGYIELINGEHNDKTYIWEILSAVGNEVGEVLYENVVNYIDNAANINTCKLRPLKSIAQVLGISHFQLLGNLRDLPVDVSNALDVFSIHPQYLVAREFAADPLIKAIKENSFEYAKLYKDQINLSNDMGEAAISGNYFIKPTVNIEKYKVFIENAFFNILSSHTLQKYSDGSYIFDNFDKDELLNGETIESKILSSSTAYPADSNKTEAYQDPSTYEELISKIKAVYNIPYTFNEAAILDDIEEGLDSLDNYANGELSVLQILADIRNKQKFDRITNRFVSKLPESQTTRFAYYKEKDFFDYYKFIQTIYAKLELDKDGINHITRYELDKNYTELNYDEFSIVADETLHKEIEAFLKKGDEKLEMHWSVAKNLTAIAFAIMEIREQLKLQAQKNYLRGTKLLLEYVVAEYLKNNLSHKYPSLSAALNSGKEDTKLKALVVEYDDGTEYFNISSHNTPKAYNRNSVNPKYWNDLDAVDVSLNGEPLEKEDISSFYNENLEIGLGDNIKDFLCAVYELGNEGSYFAENEDGTLEMRLDKEDLSSSYLSSGQILSAEYDDILSAEKEIFLLYHGSKVAYNPWLNYKNITHPSFQTHPFIYKFVEHVQKTFAIKNAFQGEAPVYLMKKLHSDEISTYLDKLGTLSNLWQVQGSIYDYSGWQSRYEYEDHSDKKFNGKLSPVTDYDGTFYPPAVDEFADAISSDYLDAVAKAKKEYETDEPTEEQISEFNSKERYLSILSSVATKTSLDEEGNETFYGKYYSHLLLTEDDAVFISRQLSTFTEDILEIVTPKADDSKIYDIYKYGLDKYNNSFILYKQYEHGKNATAEEKRNTLGSLWFRLNNHPIGFPAFSYEISDNVLENVENNRFVCSPINLFDKPQMFDFAEDFYKEDGITPDTAKIDREKTTIRRANKSFLSILKKMGRNGKVFLDVEFTPSTEFLVLVSPKNIETWNTEESDEKVVLFPNQAYQLQKLQFLKEKTKTTSQGREYHEPIVRYVYSFLNYDALVEKWTEIELEGKFKGFAKNKSILYSLAVDALDNGTEDVATLKLECSPFPPMSQTTSVYSRTIDLSAVSTNENGSLDYMQTGMWTKFKKEDAKNIQVAYNDEHFYLAFPTIYDSNNYKIRTFVGAHSLSSADMAENDDYGKNSYDDGTVLKDEMEHNSFDRFVPFITILDIPLGFVQGSGASYTPSFKNYILNSDSSWIPSYPGLEGYSQTWTVEQYRNSIHQSAELLGHSFNKLPQLILEKKRSLGLDEDGNYSVSDLDSLLSTSLRVYEDFQLSDYVDYKTNEPIKDWETDEDGEQYYEWTVDLLSSVNEENLNDYQIMFFNLKSGSYNSIVNCYLSDLTEEFSDENVSYCPTDSVYETGLLDGKPPTERLRVVGTPNPFGSVEDIDSETVTNHLINIKGVKVKFVKNDEGLYSLVFRFYRNRTFGTKIDGTETDYKNFYLHRKTLGTFVFKESLSEFEKYHYMEPFTLWPYAPTMISGTNEEDYTSASWPTLEEQKKRPTTTPSRPPHLWSGEHTYDPNYNVATYEDALSGQLVKLYSTLSSSYPISHTKLEGIDLTNYTSLSSIYELRGGYITWKMSEEDRFNTLKDIYPPKLIDSMLYGLFDMNNVNKSMDNIFSLSNTFIFQLEDPKEMSELISEVAVPIYTITDECFIAWEDYLSDSYFVDSEGVELIPYIEHFDDSNNANVCAITTPIDKDEHPEDYFKDDVIYAVSSWLDDVDIGQYKYQEDLWDFLNGEGKEVKPAVCDTVDERSMSDVRYFTVSPEQLEDYLKLYVSYSMYPAPVENDPDNEEIELHFNIQNLFMPLYKQSTTGKSYHTIVKPGTFLSLKSHETGILQVVLQLQFIDGSGNIAGIRDLPILTYKIANLSDDKPKFVASRIWRIDNRDGNSNTLSGMSNAFLIVDTVKYGISQLSSFIGTNYEMEEDFPATTKMYLFSDMPISSLWGTFYYETGKGFSVSQNESTFVHEDEWSAPGTYKTDDAFVDFALSGRCAQANLEFTLKEGMLIPEDEPDVYFPIDVLSANAVDTKGNMPKITILNGGIEFDFDFGNRVVSGKYLGREANPNDLASSHSGVPEIKLGDALNSIKFGWILEESDRSLIRMYNAKYEGVPSLSSDTDDIVLLIPDGGKDSHGNPTYQPLVASQGGGGTRATVRKNPQIIFSYQDQEGGKYADDF